MKKFSNMILAMALLFLMFPALQSFADMTTGTGDRINQRNRLTTAVPAETATRKTQQIQAAVAPIGNATQTTMADDNEFYIVGENLDVPASGGEVIWDGTTTFTYPNTATAAAVECVSDSNTDSKTATGVNSVHVWGLDGDYEFAEEDVFLYGQNPKWTTGTYIRILGVEAKTYGTGLTSAGNIYVGTGACTSGVPATIYAKARTGVNRSQSAVFTVPADKYASITGWGVNAAKADEVWAQLLIRRGGSLADQGFEQVDKIYAYQMPVNKDSISVPLAIADEGSDISINAIGDGFSTSVTAYMKLVLRSK